MRSPSVPEEVAVPVDLDFEPGSRQPRRTEPVRFVLCRGEVRTVRARATADRVKLVEPVEDPHGRSVEAERLAVVGKRPLRSGAMSSLEAAKGS